MSTQVTLLYSPHLKGNAPDTEGKHKPLSSTNPTLQGEDRSQGSLRQVAVTTPGMLSQERVNKIATEAIATYQAEGEGDDAEHVSMPALREATEQGRLTRDARLVQLLAKFNINSAEDQNATLKNALTSMLSQAEGRKQRLGALAEKFDSLTAELKDAQAALESGLGDVSASQSAYDRASGALEESKKELQRLKENGVSEDDPAWIAAQKKMTEAEGAVGMAREQLAGAIARLEAMQNKAQNLIDRHSAALDEMWLETRNSAGQTIMGRAVLDSANKDSMSSLARMILLISTMIETINEGNASKLKNDLAVNEARMESVRKRNLKLAAEHEEQVRKAEKAAKTGNCITKILGGLAAVVGVAAAILTGGLASSIGLGLTAIGIGLLVADTIAEAATGETLTGKIINPLMEHILTPMMNAIGKIVGEIFDKTPLGLLLNAIDKATGANMMNYVHQAVTAVVVVSAIIAAAMLLRSGAKIFMEQLSKRMVAAVIEAVKTSVKKVIEHLPKLVKTGLEAGNKMATNMVQSVDDIIASAVKKMNLTQGNRIAFAKGANLAAEGLQFTQVASGATHNIISAEFRMKSEKTLANFMISQNVLDVLTKSMETLLDVLKRNDDHTHSEIRRLSEIHNQSMNTSALILKKMKV